MSKATNNTKTEEKKLCSFLHGITSITKQSPRDLQRHSYLYNNNV